MGGLSYEINMNSRKKVFASEDGNFYRFRAVIRFYSSGPHALFAGLLPKNSGHRRFLVAKYIHLKWDFHISNTLKCFHLHTLSTLLSWS